MNNLEQTFEEVLRNQRALSFSFTDQSELTWTINFTKKVIPSDEKEILALDLNHSPHSIFHT